MTSRREGQYFNTCIHVFYELQQALVQRDADIHMLGITFSLT